MKSRGAAEKSAAFLMHSSFLDHGVAILFQEGLHISHTRFGFWRGSALPIVYAAQVGDFSPLITTLDSYASNTQPRSLRVIESELKPVYKAKNDTLEFHLDYAIMPALTFTSQTGYNTDTLASIEDFNRFNSNPGIFFTSTTEQYPGNPDSPGSSGLICGQMTPGGVMCDPQLGCSTRFVGEDLSQEHSWQMSQEFRLASNFSGPLNFSVGANHLHYETFEDYYVFLNLLTLVSRLEDKADSGHGPYPFIANGLCGGVPQPHRISVMGRRESSSVLFSRRRYQISVRGRHVAAT